MPASVAMPAVRQNRSKLAPTCCQASSTIAAGTTPAGVVDSFMALLSFVDSAPRAYRLKAGNAYLTFSTSTGTSPQIREIEAARLVRLEHNPEQGSHAMVRLLAQVIGIGIETADMLVHEVFVRNLRDRKAVARYGGLTGSPDESGAQPIGAATR